ncbi:MAG: GntR family transcriptional regulator [candidate division NC10 bacterium]
MIFSGAVEFMSKRSLVEDAIKRAIHEGSFAPGQKLNLEEIARQLKVSRTPVREAFRALELQGYLRVEPCVGTIVLGLEPQEITEIYTIRFNLEGLATRLAVPNITGEDLRGLEESLDQITALDPANAEYTQIDRLNQSFHFGIYERGKNRRLLEMIRSLWESVVRYRARNTQIEGFLARSTQDHRAILDAIRRKDSQQAEALMQAHLGMSCQSLLKQVTSRGAMLTG